MRRAVDAATEAGAQDARDERQLGAAAHDVQACDVTAELTDPGGIGDEQGFHGLDRCIHERCCGVIEIRDGDRCGFAVDGYGNELRRGGEGLLGGASILDEAFPRGVSEQTGVSARRCCETVRQDDVEIITADQVQAARSQDLVQCTGGRHDRGVEGTAAEVVDEDRGALRVQGTRVAVRVLEARSGGFVDHREDVPACTAERLEGQEALRRPGVRGNADESLKLLRGGHGGNRRVRAHRARDIRQEAGERVEYGDAVVAQAQCGCVGNRRIRQQALEGAQVGRTLAGSILGVKAVDEMIAVQRED